MIQSNGDKRRTREEAELRRNESSVGSDGFAKETRGQQVASLESSSSSIGRGRFRARPGDDQEDSRLHGGRVEPSSECGREFRLTRELDMTRYS